MILVAFFTAISPIRIKPKNAIEKAAVNNFISRVELQTCDKVFFKTCRHAVPARTSSTSGSSNDQNCRHPSAVNV